MRIKKRTSWRVSFWSCRSFLSTHKSRVILWLLLCLLLFLSSRYLRPLCSSLLRCFYPWWFLRNRFTKSRRLLLLLVVINWLFLESFARYPINRFVWFAFIDTLILCSRGNICIFHFLYSLFWLFCFKKIKYFKRRWILYCNIKLTEILIRNPINCKLNLACRGNTRDKN